MDPISGGLSLLGGLASNAASARAAEKQMEFQKWMASHSYQLAVGDMRKAGLNPALAYMQGGASTPSGAQAEVKDALTPAVSTALQAKQLEAQLQLLNEQRHTQWTTQANQAMDTKLKEQQIKKTDAETELTSNSAKAVGLGIPALENKARVESGDIGHYGAYGSYLLELLGKGAGVLKRGK